DDPGGADHECDHLTWRSNAGPIPRATTSSSRSAANSSHIRSTEIALTPALSPQAGRGRNPRSGRVRGRREETLRSDPMDVIDLNCDMGESFGAWTMGSDAEMLRIVTSANVACGFHGGDPLVMYETVSRAKQNRVGIGAHPSFYDIWGFG